MRGPAESDHFAVERQNMVDAQLRARGIHDPRVLDAMCRVPRHQFVPEQYRPHAYEDYPIQIGEGQTISQPYIVARMLEALSIRTADVTLEIGTGSGYQTALLAELSRHVYSIERLEMLAGTAKWILGELGYTNAEIMIGDGSQGLPDRAPFDVIVISAAAPRVPDSLIAQIREGGRMILPVGPPKVQELQLLRKLNGHPEITRLESCRFVPLIGACGYSVRD